MDDILLKHAIDPKCLRTDDFAGFIATRERELLNRISNAMGKDIAAETSTHVDEDYLEEDAAEDDEEVA